jgi:response regulator RpfG family c-di-GMP phosphodiesterase
MHPDPSPIPKPSRPASADAAACSVAAAARSRRTLVAGGLVLAAVAVVAVVGVGGAVGAALEAIAARSGVAGDPEVRSLIGRARLWGVVAAAAVVGTALAMTVWISARHARELARLEAAVARETEASAGHRRAVVDGLVRLAAARDGDTGGHLTRVGEYVRLLAEQLRGRDPEVDDAFIEAIVQMAPLHDIGKVGLSDEILLKPGPLSSEERAEMQKHVLLGLDTLVEVKRRCAVDDDGLRIACEVAFAHHERFDGTGYPFGLAGTAIPLSARIMALADVYDALRNERVYKKAMDHPEARDIIVAHAGTHFDPAVVDAFVAVEDRFAAIAAS